jgi:glutathione S-transferase
VLQWMFFEQYSHEPYVAVARYINAYLPADSPRRADLPRLVERGYQALDVMEKHLAGRDFFVGESYSIADIALFAYTNPAADGGFDLSRYKAINAWLARVRTQPGYVEMPGAPRNAS